MPRKNNRNNITRLSAAAIAILATGCTSHSTRVSPAVNLKGERIVVPRPVSVAERKALADKEYSNGNLLSSAQQLAICTGMGDKSRSTELKLASCYQQVNEPELAANQLLSAISVHKDSSSLRAAYVDALLRLGDFQDAGAMCRAMIPSLSSLTQPDKLIVGRGIVLSGDPSGLDRVLMSLGPTPESLQLRAQAMMLQGDASEAVKVLRQLLAGNDNGVWTTYLFAGALQMTGDFRRALKYYSRATTMRDCPVDAYAEAALLDLKMGQASDAEALIKRAPQSADNDPAMWLARSTDASEHHNSALAELSRGYMYYHSGDPWHAESIWKTAIKSAHGKQTRALYTAIFDSAFARHARNTALTYVNEAVNRWPANTRLLKDQAEIWLSLNNAAGAERVARRLRTMVSTSARGPVDELICRAALDAGDGREVQRAAHRDEVEEPASALPYLHYGEYESQNTNQLATGQSLLKIYQAAAAADGTNPQAWVHMGELKATDGNIEGAILDFLKALNLDTRINGGDVCAQLSALYSRMGMSREAHYQMGLYTWQHHLVDKWQSRMKLMRTGSGSAADWMKLGGQALNRHNNWVALCAFQRVLRIHPNSVSAWASLAAVWRRLGQFNYALGAMQRAFQLTNTSRTAKR